MAVPAAPGWLVRTLFPGGVRLWHFIVLPAAGMGLVIAVSRLAEQVLATHLGPAASDVYAVARPVLITLLMASLIAWLAITHRREYETALESRNAALESTRDFLQRVIEGSGEAIVTVDRDGRVTSWNRSAEQIYGYGAGEMLGQPVENLFPDDPGTRREWNEAKERLRAGETIRDYETTRIRKDGSLIVVRITRSPLDDGSGGYAGSTAIIRDVTALKAMETRLLESERLAAVGELAAQVAHEIRNPLAGIRGACEIIAEGFREGETRAELATEVLRQVDRLNRTVEELLLFARPRAVQPAPTDIHELIDRTLGVLMEDPRTHGVTVERRYGNQVGPVDLDPVQFEQVLINLFLNAFQIMDYRGTITVGTRVNGTQAEITIHDTGPGIPDGLKERIFKPFFTTRAQGSGLGLAIVRNLVQAHGGSVLAYTAKEGGAVFRIRLPKSGASRA